jgi:hypothetical protein
MRIIIAPLHSTTKTLMATMDTDTETFNAYLTVQKMTETNEEEKRLSVSSKCHRSIDILYPIFYFSKQITENRCLERYLDVSLDIMRQINALWEPLQRLAPLFNISTKADFLVSFQQLQ